MSPTERTGRRRNVKKWTRNLRQIARNSRESKVNPTHLCPHVRKESSQYCIKHLRDEDVEAFVSQLYSSETAAGQYLFLSQYIVPFNPVAHRSRKAEPRKRTQNQYFIRTKDGNLILLCAAAFQNISSIKRKRLNTI